ncbi:hypothetical protein GEV33_001299 [Tenebrio molitor]|uniref:Uncharacterized protein n=1 Tax=Tenebrio molitor TaxID=7067 RepID=A0A8J6HVR9_TENMO|nr:hypothetical protein GEV33_001299 [Tenebrio molitor]
MENVLFAIKYSLRKRGRVKSGVRLLEAASAGDPAWNMTVDINPRHTGATVTLVRKEPPDSEIANSDAELPYEY